MYPNDPCSIILNRFSEGPLCNKSPQIKRYVASIDKKTSKSHFRALDLSGPPLHVMKEVL